MTHASVTYYATNMLQIKSTKCMTLLTISILQGNIWMLSLRGWWLILISLSLACYFWLVLHIHTILRTWKQFINSKAGKKHVLGSMPPCIGCMELLAWMQRADFSEHIQCFKPHGNPLNSSHFDTPNTKFALTGYRRAPNIISHHYKQELSAKASIILKDQPIRFR